MKPNSKTAMLNLIQQARETIPFDHPTEEFCGDSCTGCSIKLLEYLQSELDSWEDKLHQGVIPNLGELSKLGKTCKKIYRILELNGLIEPVTLMSSNEQ